MFMCIFNYPSFKVYFFRLHEEIFRLKWSSLSLVIKIMCKFLNIEIFLCRDKQQQVLVQLKFLHGIM